MSTQVTGAHVLPALSEVSFPDSPKSYTVNYASFHGY